MGSPHLVVRSYSAEKVAGLTRHGVDPVLARIYTARGVTNPDQLDMQLSILLPFESMKNIVPMAGFLADAIETGKTLLIVADYDSDGATACAVGIRALRKLGAVVDYLVPNRFEHGYGLTPEIVRLAANRLHRPDIIITVDSGIASVEGVDEANQLGIQVLVTDHHLPGDRLPAATMIIDPNQPGCDFPGKDIAGVGVIFYLMLALRAALRQRGVFTADRPEPNLASLLDLVALGTVADVVKLDKNNRILVQQGLERIRQGRGCAGIRALLQATKRDARKVSTYELGFVLGPRLNAAGRLSDMAIGIECLITDDDAHALKIASQLDGLNYQRRRIEAEMQDDVLATLDTVQAEDSHSLCLYDPDWHQGVTGILASRIKDRFYRPVIVFAPGSGGEIKGSGRSINGFHLRDALDRVSKQYPCLILRFGGHAAAAGLTIPAEAFDRFRHAFEQVCRLLLTPADLARVIETDGGLNESEMTVKLAQCLSEPVWGQGFPPPVFVDEFIVEHQQIVGEKHLRLKLRKHVRYDEDGRNDRATMAGSGREAYSASTYYAILFSYNELLPSSVRLVYRIQVNEYNGNSALQLVVDHWFPVTP